MDKPVSEMVERVGHAIEYAWWQDQELPPIEFTSGERRWLASAAIKAMRDELRKLPNTQYAIDTLSAALGDTNAA